MTLIQEMEEQVCIVSCGLTSAATAGKLFYTSLPACFLWEKIALSLSVVPLL